MKPTLSFLSLSFFIVVILALTNCQKHAFPTDFAWGTATSAYQIEGAWNISGKGLSWNDWYNVLKKLPLNRTGFIADDFYHRYNEDIALMKKLGYKHFRMSISWSRVLPVGTVDKPNPEGVDFYNRVFTALKENGIEPWVTLYHADLPQALNWPNATGSFLNPNMPELFSAYAEFCYKNFGDKVKNWITFNEPQLISWFGYGNGWGLPYRCTKSYNPECETLGGGGDSSTEPYLSTHIIILAHAKSVQIYRQKYKASQGGQVGLDVNVGFSLPWNVSNPNDIAAVDTSIHFTMGWFTHPLYFGEYPKIMQEYVGKRLPKFTPEEVQLVKGANDFLGVNHYTSGYVHYTGKVGTDYGSDSRVDGYSTDINGVPIGPQGESDWLFSYPKGMRGILNWIKTNYNNPPVVILENGFDIKGESKLPMPQALTDTQRIEYLNGYIDNLVSAVVQDGVNVKGYFVWSFMDNFEWGSYDLRFGLVHVNYEKNLTRTPKASAAWYTVKTRSIKSWAEGRSEYPYYDSDAEMFLPETIDA